MAGYLEMLERFTPHDLHCMAEGNLEFCERTYAVTLDGPEDAVALGECAGELFRARELYLEAFYADTGDHPVYLPWRGPERTGCPGCGNPNGPCNWDCRYSVDSR